MHALAHILASQSEHISTQWLSRLGRTSPHLAQRTPQLLAELSTVFDERFGEPAAATPSVRERWRHPRGFELAQVVEEYSVLRDCVLDTFEAAGASMGVRELRVLIDFFAQALAEAVSDHTEQARSAELANQLAASASRDAEREALLLREQAARAEAQAERVKLHELFMQAPVPIAIVEGPAHTFTFANPAYRALVNGREVLGKPLLEALPDLAGQGFDLLLDDVKKTGKAFVGLEVPVKLEHHGEGQVLWLNFTYTPKRDAAGVAEGVLVAAADVTEQVLARQRTEALAEAVRSSETELRLVTDAVPVLISFVTPDERYGMVNKAYERWFGVSTEELVGRKLEDVLGKPAYERMRPYVLRGLAGEHVSFEQHGVPYRLGGNKDVSVKFVPRYSASGDVDGYVALIEDITARRQLHAKAEQLAQQRTDDLEAAGDLLRSFVNNLPELAWSAAPDGSVDFYNQRWFDYTGTTFEEVKGWGWETLHDPATLPKVKEAWLKSITTGEPFEMEFPLRARDGSFRWFLTRVQPVRDRAGTIVRWFGTTADIHDQRETAQRIAAASQAKDEFLATASHELRTPLSAILGWVRMLRSGQLEPNAYARGLETIERNARAQVQLIEDILDGSRVINGKLHLEVKSVDLTALVHAALDAVRPAAEAKGIRLVVELDPAAARVLGDPERLQQVVWNLANNAVKFTPKGGTVDVRLTRSGTSILLVVADNGQGISADFLPHVFERFRQAENSTARRHGGLGLGLALVRHLVEAHGGTVQAESEGEGLGARFSVSLPVQAVYPTLVDPERARPTPIDPILPPGVPKLLAGIKVLVVDDEDDGRELVATVLRASGAEVIAAGSATVALELLAREAPRLLISDIGMPQIDGYELMRRLRSMSGGSAKIPAIALTAYAREQDRRLALEAGFQTHVAKPVEPAELVKVAAGLIRQLG